MSSVISLGSQQTIKVPNETIVTFIEQKVDHVRILIVLSDSQWVQYSISVAVDIDSNTVEILKGVRYP